MRHFIFQGSKVVNCCLLRMYWEPVVMKRLLGNQAGVYGDVIGIVSVVLIVALTMLLSIAWDRYRRTRQVAGGA